MSRKAPPVPPANQSSKGPGDAASGRADNSNVREGSPSDPDKQGGLGNIRENTTHQGHQQDR